eukprot:TRINITY_DN1937_c0_g1_i3.p1 TRINITY_DN1937_c0_g1~~TRINITY_DN1937_c0_g1_i3.p1  ORF type:complete len:686 (-),score=130.72 TRINITY_DN1937_c0_g1_i3:399-2456(-)
MKVSNPIISVNLQHPALSSQFQVDVLSNSIKWDLNWNDKSNANGDQNESKEIEKNRALDLKNITEYGDKPSWNSGGTSNFLPEERKKATFNSLDLSYLLYGGEKGYTKRKWVLDIAEGTDYSDIYNWDRSQYIWEHLNHFTSIHEKFWDKYVPTREELDWMICNSVVRGGLGPSYGLVLPTLRLQASEQQQKWWVGRLNKCQIVGSYAQTELGHGSNVRGIETTAVYDKVRRVFVCNTPTLTSMKWWPSNIGRLATHCVLYAQLIIDGKELGVHAFMMQIRDENHKTLKGIECGDLGNKIGDHANDTGYMRLHNVEIPREFMLSKYQEITEEGEYKVSPERKKNEKLHYATMMLTRSSMIMWAHGYLARACTIAIRYSCVRKQGFVDNEVTSYLHNENSIMDYQIQKHRLFKQLSLCYAIKFTGMWMLQMFHSIEQKNSLSDVVENFEQISATSAGLKAFCSFMAAEGIEDCRKACGGNGYLLNSGLAQNGVDYVWNTTAEGDHVLLMLLTGRYLLKMFKNSQEGKRMQWPFDYLNNSESPKDVESFEQWESNSQFLLSWYSYKANFLTQSIGNKFAQLTMGGMKFSQAWNDCSIQIMEAVKALCLYLLVSRFFLIVESVENKDLKVALHQLACFFALTHLNLTNDGVVNSVQFLLVSDATASLLNKLKFIFTLFDFISICFFLD